MSDDLKAGEAYPPLPGDEGQVPEPPPPPPEEPPTSEMEVPPPLPPPLPPTEPGPKSPTGKVTRGTAIRKGTRQVERPTGATAKVPVKSGPTKPSGAKKAVFLAFPILILLAIAGGFFVKDTRGFSVWAIWADKLGIKKLKWTPPPPRDRPPSQKEMDLKYDMAWGKYIRGKSFVEGLKRTEENLETKTVEDLDEIVKDLSKHRDDLDQGLPSIEAVVTELDRALKSPEGTTTLTEKDPKIVYDQLKEYTGFRKLLNSNIVKWTDIADKKAGRTRPISTPPPQAKFEAYKIHPWGIAPAKQWVRHRIDSSTAGVRKTVFRDQGVTSRVEGGLQLAEVLSDGGGGTETTVRFAAADAKTLPEEKLTIGDRDWNCMVVELTETGVTRKIWISLEGRAAGKLVLKEQIPSTGTVVEATKVHDGGRTFPVKNIPYAVLEIDYREEGPNGRSTSTIWFNVDFPGRVLKRAWFKGEDSVTEEVIDMGNDWTERPRFPDPSAVSPSPSPVPSPSPSPSPVPSPSASPSPEPSPSPPIVKRPDPWANRPEGSWIRVRTFLKNQFGESELHQDAMLKARADRTVSFVTQNWNKGVADREAESQYPTPAALGIRSAGEEKLTLDGREVDCRIEEYRNEIQTFREWFDPSGPPVFLKQVIRHAPPNEPPVTITTTVTKLGREKLTAAGVEFDCWVIEQEVEGQMEGPTRVKLWYSPDCPWGNVKVERWSKPHGKDKYTLQELVEMGVDWSARKPPALREDPKVKAQRALDDADRLKNEGVKLFVEVRDASQKGWPADKAGIQALLKKAKAARERFTDASMKLDLGRSAAPDLKQLRDTQKQLEELAKVAEGYAKELEAKLK